MDSKCLVVSAYFHFIAFETLINISKKNDELRTDLEVDVFWSHFHLNETARFVQNDAIIYIYIKEWGSEEIGTYKKREKETRDRESIERIT
jgi:hypothetical protein